MPPTDLTKLDVADRIFADGYYDDGEGTAFAMPAVQAVCPIPSDEAGSRVVLDSGKVMDLPDEDPIEMAHVFRAWGVARREADRVLASRPETEDVEGSVTV